MTFTTTLWKKYLGCINANYDDFKVYTAFKFYVPDLDSKLIQKWKLDLDVLGKPDSDEYK